MKYLMLIALSISIALMLISGHLLIFKHASDIYAALTLTGFLGVVDTMAITAIYFLYKIITE